MEYIKPHPKKSNWSVDVLVDDDVVVAAHTGWTGYSDYLLKKGVKLGLGSAVLPNFIFRGALSPTGFGRGRSSVTQDFIDRDCPQVGDDYAKIEYEMAAKATSELLAALANGNVTIEDGHFVGLFTFVKQGEQISIVPYIEKE